MFGSFLPSLLVGFRTTNFTRDWEPTLSWNQSHQQSDRECKRLLDVNNPLDSSHPRLQTLSMRHKRGVDIGLWGVFLLPFLFVAAGLSMPYTLVRGYFQRRNKRAFQNRMDALGRIMEWSDFRRALDETRGTAIIERYSFKGPVYLWWTPENLYEACPYPTVDWMTLHEESFLLFAEWCRERYTSPNSGRAFLVGPSPEGEGRSLHSRFKSAEEGRERWIEVVPPEILRKRR